MIGRHCVLVAKVGISGSTVLGDFVAMGGECGTVGHIRIGMGAQIAGAANVKDDVPRGARMAGTPARPIREFARELAAVKRLASGRGNGAAGIARRNEADMNEATPATLESADIPKLLTLLPHRYPFLMVDRIVEIDGDESAVGIKNVTFNEPHFLGHFPGQPVMPGVLLIEAMAQTAGAICVLATQPAGEAEARLFHDHRQVQVPQAGDPGRPGRLHLTKLKSRRNMWWYRGEARVDGALVAEAVISAMLVAE